MKAHSLDLVLSSKEHIYDRLIDRSAKAYADQYLTLGMPNKALEDWRYYPWKLDELNAFQVEKDHSRPPISSELRKLSPYFILLSGDQCLEKNLPEGCSLHRSEKAPWDLMGLQYPFAHYSVATAGSFLLEVNEAVSVGHPVVIIHRQSEAASKVSNFFVKLHQNSQLQIFDVFEGEGSSFDFLNFYAKLQRSSKLSRVKFQKRDNASLLSFDHVDLAEAAEFSNLNCVRSCLKSRDEIHAVLREKSAKVSLKGLFLGEANSLFDQCVKVFHLAVETESEQLFKNVLYDQAVSNFNGMIFIDQVAQRTNAFQLNKNLVLSDDAKANTKPQLEVYADDVKAAHGATVGSIEASELFYLRSRGISESVARELLIQGYYQEVLMNLDGTLKDYLLSSFDRKRV